MMNFEFYYFSYSKSFTFSHKKSIDLPVKKNLDVTLCGIILIFKSFVANIIFDAKVSP